MSARPKNEHSPKRTERLVVYLDKELDDRLEQATRRYVISRSDIGYDAVKKWLDSNEDKSTYSYSTSTSSSTTGVLSSASLTRENPIDIDLSFSARVPSSQRGELEIIQGKVTKITTYGDHIQFQVEGRCSFVALAGRFENGLFLMFPSDGVAVTLSHNPQDVFYNQQKVLNHPYMNHLDGIAAVHALQVMSTAGYI